jgi:hypothetical protein
MELGRTDNRKSMVMKLETPALNRANTIPAPYLNLALKSASRDLQTGLFTTFYNPLPLLDNSREAAFIVLLLRG